MKVIFKSEGDDGEFTELNKAIKGKVIKFFTDENDQQSLLTFNFTDGTSLIITYDWIYSIELLGKE